MYVYTHTYVQYVDIHIDQICEYTLGGGGLAMSTLEHLNAHHVKSQNLVYINLPGYMFKLKVSIEVSL